MNDETKEFDLIKNAPSLDSSASFRQEVMSNVRNAEISKSQPFYDFFKIEEWFVSAALCGFSCFLLLNYQNENQTIVDSSEFSNSLEEVLVNENMSDYFFEELSLDSVVY